MWVAQTETLTENELGFPVQTHPIMIIHIVINVTVLDEFWNKRLYILFIGSFGICQCVNEMVFFWRFDLDQVSSVLPTNLSSVIPLVCQPVEQQITRWVKSRPSLWADTSCRTENKIWVIRWVSLSRNLLLTTLLVDLIIHRGSQIDIHANRKISNHAAYESEIFTRGDSISFLSFLFQLKKRNNEECAYTKILAILWLTINFFPFWFK